MERAIGGQPNGRRLAERRTDGQAPREGDLVVGERRLADDFRHHPGHHLIGLDHAIDRNR